MHRVCFENRVPLRQRGVVSERGSRPWRPHVPVQRRPSRRAPSPATPYSRNGRPQTFRVRARSVSWTTGTRLSSGGQAVDGVTDVVEQVRFCPRSPRGHREPRVEGLAPQPRAHLGDRRAVRIPRRTRGGGHCRSVTSHHIPSQWPWPRRRSPRRRSSSSLIRWRFGHVGGRAPFSGWILEQTAARRDGVPIDRSASGDRQRRTTKSTSSPPGKPMRSSRRRRRGWSGYPCALEPEESRGRALSHTRISLSQFPSATPSHSRVTQGIG